MDWVQKVKSNKKLQQAHKKEGEGLHQKQKTFEAVLLANATQQMVGDKNFKKSNNNGKETEAEPKVNNCDLQTLEKEHKENDQDIKRA